MESMVSPQFSAVERKLIRAVMEENVEELEQICVSLPTDFNINDVFEKSYTLYGSLEETPLLYLACCAKNSDILKILVKYGGDLYINKLDGTNIFHYACGNKNLDVMKFILEECSDVDFLHTFSNNGNDMLSFVADSFEENQKEAQVLIECLASKGKFNINRIQGDGFTVLLKAVSLNRCELADILCQLGGDVNFGYLNSLKAIQWVSMQCGYHNMIQILINHGANKNEIWRGQRPIHLALSRGLTENATVLMRAGVDISGSIKLHYPKKMWISTFCLAAWRCPTLIPEFLALGASPNEMDRSTGYSVIEFALEGNASRDVIKSLLQAGADINRGCPGKTAIEFCKSIDQLLAFIDWGVSVKTIESQIGTSLLSMAISNSSEDTAEEHVKYLLSKGANLKDPANGKDSILISSLKRRFYRIADFLIGQGVNLNHRDGEWSTALHVICKQVDGCSPRRITFGKTALFFCQNFECRRTMPAAQFHSTQSSSSAPCNGS
ncbi:putative ankyrin repeat protein RF_0381, partial [Saccostrea cucullata]|uniref:putative ankyrin repeat protein RF_0381 n=1 Tax=Saccostrea cuccullata TaxID=36930 RepID=UPI002ED40210